MKFLKFIVIVVALAMLGSTFTVDAKAKKRRSTVKKEKQMKAKTKCTSIKSKCTQTDQCSLDMVEYCNQGMMMTPVAQMRVERKDGNVVFVIKGTTTEEKEYVIDDGEQILKDALKIIEEEKMLEYKSSYSLKASERVLDGETWSFRAKLADGRSVSSHGSNAWPGGDGLSRIGKLLYDRAYELLEANHQQ